MKNSYQKIIEGYLKSRGPCLSSELAKYLQTTTRCSVQAARQAVYRLENPINKLKGINFQDAQKFVYLSEHFGSAKFREKLIEMLIIHRTAAGRAILAINSRGGFIRKSDFDAIACAPILNLSGQLKSSVVRDQLIKNNLLMEETYDGTEYYRIFDSTSSNLIAHVEQRISDLLLKKCAEWALRVGFTSKNSGRLRGSKDVPQFGLFAWDYTSPTFLHGLRQWKSKKKISGFFAVDVLVKQDPIVPRDLAAYFHKIEVIQSQKNSKRFIPALIHLGMEEELLMNVRDRGIMCLEPRSFGDPQLADIIKELLRFLENARQFFGDQDRLNLLIAKMLTTDFGRLLNLPGPLFQIIVAFLYKCEGHLIETGKMISSSESEAEIDVYVLTNSREIIAIETKGYKKGKELNLDEVEKWISERRPRIIKWFQINYQSQGYTLRFEFIISSKFSDPQLKRLNTHASHSYRNFPITFLDIKHVISMANKYKQYEIVKGLNEHF